MSQQINIPEVVAEIRGAFDRYEQALAINDVDVLNELFWDSPHTIRYGGGENLYGAGEIAAFRGARDPRGMDRILARVTITTFGRDFATASTLTKRTATGRTGRQMQTWVRMAAGWRIVAAHVSFLEYDFPS